MHLRRTMLESVTRVWASRGRLHYSRVAPTGKGGGQQRARSSLLLLERDALRSFLQTSGFCSYYCDFANCRVRADQSGRAKIICFLLAASGAHLGVLPPPALGERRHRGLARLAALRISCRAIFHNPSPPQISPDACTFWMH